MVSELAYEYQSGKWSDDGFAQEPYQVPISENMRLLARGILDDPGLLSRLEDGWRSDRPSKMSAPKLATFCSGSAVIASDEFMNRVASYHRRVSGLDMEIYGVQRAVHLAQCRPEVICVKAVVDLADGEKNKHLQPYGSFISARFLIEAVAAYFLGK